MSKHMVGYSSFTVQHLKAPQNQAVVSLRDVSQTKVQDKKRETFKREGCATTIFLNSFLAINVQSLTKMICSNLENPISSSREKMCFFTLAGVPFHVIRDGLPTFRFKICFTENIDSYSPQDLEPLVPQGQMSFGRIQAEHL